MGTTKTFFHASSTRIPNWMTAIDSVLSRRPVPSMRGPGTPADWAETWEALESVLQSQATKAGNLAQEMQLSPTPWPAELSERVRIITAEPMVPADALHLASTGRGLILLVAPQGFDPTMFPDGLLQVCPWGREGVKAWTRFRGDMEQIDASLARPWAWAAWRCRRLMTLVERPKPQPMDLSIPNYMALQMAGVLK